MLLCLADVFRRACDILDVAVGVLGDGVVAAYATRTILIVEVYISFFGHGWVDGEAIEEVVPSLLAFTAQRTTSVELAFGCLVIVEDRVGA